MVAHIANWHLHLLPNTGIGGGHWEPPGHLLHQADTPICGSDVVADRLWAAISADISWEASGGASGNAYVWLRPRYIRYDTEHKQQVQDRMRLRRAALQ